MNSPQNRKKLVIVGGGAAGFFTAINTAILNPGIHITILEKYNKVLQKVKVSGGGRCNVTHHCFENRELVEKYPRGKNFLKKLFQIFSTKDAIAWFASRGISLHNEHDGRMFPVSNSSQTIIDCFMQEVIKYKIDICYNANVVAVLKKENTFEVHLQNKKIWKADFVCIASGSYQSMLQYSWLQSLHHTIINPVPSLFTFNIVNKTLTELMGVSVANVEVKIIQSKLVQQGPILITHWGLSGPCILKLSAWGAKELAERKYNFSIVVNWVNIQENDLRNTWNTLRAKQGAQLMIHKNPFELPTRLWKYLLQLSEINATITWSTLASKQQNKLIQNLCAQPLDVKGKTTFKEEFVTCGGIDLLEVDVKTMMSKRVENLFFAGEVLDVDGITGGFNFQHAWSSGFVVAQSIANA